MPKFQDQAFDKKQYMERRKAGLRGQGNFKFGKRGFAIIGEPRHKMFATKPYVKSLAARKRKLANAAKKQAQIDRYLAIRKAN